MARILPALLTGAVLILLALLWREHARALELQARLAETETRLARPVATPPKASSAKRVESNAVPDPAAARPAPPAQPSAPPPARTFSEAEQQFRQGLTEQRRWTALAKKADLLAALNLPPDRSAALKDLLVERDYVERDARDAARAAGLQPHEAAAAELAKVDARIQAFLGPADYTRYTEQMSLAVFREQLDSSPIPGSLVDAGAPLTSDQRTWIAGMMYQRFGQQFTDQPPQSADPRAANRAFAATLLAEAPGKLTPEQIAALREYFRKDDELAGHMNTLIREQAQRNP